jgi:hypothetical protein
MVYCDVGVEYERMDAKKKRMCRMQSARVCWMLGRNAEWDGMLEARSKERGGEVDEDEGGGWS